MEGWIKIHRKLLDWQWYGVINVRLTFLHLLIVANHKDNYVYGNKVLRGQYLTSYDRMAKEVGITPMELRGALAKLESTGEINKQTTNKYTIITICNYDSYQCDNTTEEQTINKQTTNNYQSNNNQLTTNKNDNNDKNDKNEINNSLSIIRPTEFENFLDGQNSLWFENTKVALREPSEDKIRQLIKRFSAEMIARDEVGANSGELQQKVNSLMSRADVIVNSAENVAYKNTNVAKVLDEVDGYTACIDNAFDEGDFRGLDASSVEVTTPANATFECKADGISISWTGNTSLKIGGLFNVTNGHRYAIVSELNSSSTFDLNVGFLPYNDSGVLQGNIYGSRKVMVGGINVEIVDVNHQYTTKGRLALIGNNTRKIDVKCISVYDLGDSSSEYYSTTAEEVKSHHIEIHQQYMIVGQTLAEKLSSKVDKSELRTLDIDARIAYPKNLIKFYADKAQIKNLNSLTSSVNGDTINILTSPLSSSGLQLYIDNPTELDASKHYAMVLRYKISSNGTATGSVSHSCKLRYTDETFDEPKETHYTRMVININGSGDYEGYGTFMIENNVNKTISSIELNLNFGSFSSSYEDIGVSVSDILLSMCDIDQYRLMRIKNYPFYKFSDDMPTIPYGEIMPISSPFLNQRLLTIGDSNTFGEKWQRWLDMYLGTDYKYWITDNGDGTNPPMGINGATVMPWYSGDSNHYSSLNYRARFVHNYSPDIICIFGGLNDCGYFATQEGIDGFLGTINDAPYKGEPVSSSDALRPTFYASYKGMLEQIITNNPKAKIVCMSVMTEMPQNHTSEEIANLQAQDVYRSKVNDAIRDCAKYYHVQFVNVGQECGLNYWNSETYYGNNALHFNYEGGKRIAQYVASQLQ